jgi:hypothetical protein
MRTALARFDTPWAPTFFSAAAYLVFVLARLAMHDWDASFFVTAGDKWSNPAEVPPNLSVMRDTGGHDGQFYYRFALNPFSTRVTENGITIDLPAYRNQRFLYPFVVWTLSFGNARAVPLLLIAVNYAAVCVLTWCAARYLQVRGLHALYGLAIGCYPGFVLTLARDFTEVFSGAFLMAGILLGARERHGWAALVLALGVLARETTVLYSVATIAGWVYALRSSDRQWAKASYLAPVLVCVGWQLRLRYVWGHWASTSTGATAWPFVDYFRSLWEKTAFASAHQIVCLGAMLLIGAYAVVVALNVRRSNAGANEKLAWALNVGLASVVSVNVWGEDWSFLRNLWELYVFGTITLLLSPSRTKPVFLVAWGALWFIEWAVRMDLHNLLL